MTMLYKKSVDCTGCLSEQVIALIASSNAFGSMDLDMRPPPMQRHTIDQQIHRCSRCGFCAPKLAWYEGLDIHLLTEKPYLDIVYDASYPDLANTFRAHAYLSSAAKNHRAVLRAFLNAAWVCDDIGMTDEVAIRCRLEALKAMDTLHEGGALYTDSMANDQVLKIDLLRRSKRFYEAAALVLELDQCRVHIILCQIMELQNRLIVEQDDACYQVANVLPIDEVML